MKEPLVEAQLLALQNVPIDTATLARSARNAGENTTSSELGLESTLDLRGALAGSELALDRLRLRDNLLWLGFGGLRATTLAERDAVVGLIPVARIRISDWQVGRLG